MSKDSDLYFYDDHFPYKPWREVLDFFTGEYQVEKDRFEITLSRVKPGQDNEDGWKLTEVHRNNGWSDALWISLRKFTGNYRWNLECERPKWNISLHWSSSARFRVHLPTLLPFASFLQFREMIFYERNIDKYYLSTSEYSERFSIPGMPEPSLQDFRNFLVQSGKTSGRQG